MRWTVVLALAFVACSENQLAPFGDNVIPGVPIIDVTPPQLDFGARVPGDPGVATFDVHNVGGATLLVTGLRVDGDPAFTLASEAGFEVPPDGHVSVEVTFDAPRARPVTAEAVVSSNDAQRPEATVALIGRGLAPELDIQPPDWRFADTPVGCTDDVELILQNVGNADLTLASATIASGGALSLRGADAVAGAVLAPGGWTSVWVDYAPVAAGDDAATVTIASNDPRGPQAATQAGHAPEGALGSDTFPLSDAPPVDVVLAVDRSASMEDDAAGLAKSFGSFVSTLGAATTGWHLGVVTLDSGCFNGGVLTAARTDLTTAFSKAVATGDPAVLVNDEALLRLADLAMEVWDSGECNDGFRRPDAPLAVIVISDEPDRSHEQASAWTWDFWVDRYRGRVSDPALVAVSGVVDSDGCNEGDDGYRQAIAETGGARMSICAGDWSKRAVALAEAAAAAVWDFPLSETPVAGSITVSIDGAPLATGWSYDAARNVVHLDPVRGKKALTVDYTVQGDCR